MRVLLQGLSTHLFKGNGWTKEKTAVYISHRMSSAKFSDRILFFADGGIAEEGTHDALMALDGRYARMYQTQAHYYQ